MEERMTEHMPRNGRRPGFYMRPKHIGLVLCVSFVGCTIAFGTGFIVGMGYKASEQVSPYAVKTPTAGSRGQERVSSAAWEEGSLTFYDTLIKNEPVEMTPVAETTQVPEPTPPAPTPAQAPTPVPPAQTVVAEGIDPQLINQDIAATETIQAPDSAPTAPTPESVPAPTPPAPPAVAQGTAEQTVVASYSVQVDSFLKPERAKRLIEELTEKGYRAYLHPFEAPGQPLWYRVKVGKFADRATANLTLEKLAAQDAMVTRD